jgi:anti-sigma B factor antagonist
MLSNPDLQVTRRDEDECTILTVDGEVDAYSALLLRTYLLDAIAEGRTRLVLDLTDVDVLDTSALRVLIGVRRRAWSLRGYLDIVVDRPVILRLFRVTALDKTFALHTSLESALAARRADRAAVPVAGGSFAHAKGAS